MKSTRKAITRIKFVLRPYRRIPTWYSSYYMSGNVIGKGVVKNLSRTGLRILGDHSLSPGTQVSVRLTLGETEPPLEISRATVRWAEHYEFGLRIEELATSAAHRVADLIAADIGLGSRKAQ
jgi:PilZ domain